MRLPRSLLAVAIAVPLAAGAAACSSGDGGGGGGGDDAVPLPLGERVYVGSCQSCHGKGGGGGYGPQLSDGKVVEAYPDIEDHIAVIRDGKGGTMPPWGEKLTEEEIRAVAEYERGL